MFQYASNTFHPSIQIGKVYIISKGLIKLINKEYNHLENDWEITLDNTSIIEPCIEDDHLIANHNFKFTPINELSTLPNNFVVDILGVAISISQATTILRKNGTKTQKRTLELKDMSGCSVDLTLWGVFCNKDGLQQNSTSKFLSTHFYKGWKNK
jgi:replication factor A1